MSHPEQAPKPEQLRHSASLLTTRFVQRPDLYARQRSDGRYTCVKQPLTEQHVVDHLLGRQTLGTYILDAAGRTSLLVLDADTDDQWQSLLRLAEQLGQVEITAYCEQSRRGGHLWLFLAQAWSGSVVRRFGQGLMQRYGAASVELFPKQDQLQDGPGSLVRLPFGIHRKSEQRYGFVTPQGDPLAPTLSAQIEQLARAQTVPNRLVAYFAQYAPSRPQRTDFTPTEAAEAPLSARIKGAVSVHTFVSEYVKLSSAGIGRCPFHDDQIASFSVNDEHNYWYCFGCERGGSIIDFWMIYRRCSFRQALRELADRLGL